MAPTFMDKFGENEQKMPEDHGPTQEIQNDVHILPTNK